MSASGRMDEARQAEAPTAGEARAVGRVLRWISQPILLFLLLALVTLTTIWVSVLNLSRVEIEAARQRAEALGHELLRTYEAQVVRVLSEMDRTLISLQYVHELTGDAETSLHALRERDLLPPEIVYIVSLTDSAGSIVASTREESLGTMVDHRLLDRARDESGAAEGGAVKRDDEWWIQFGRELTASDGSFAGLAVLEIDATFMVSGYEPIELGEQGLLAVLGTDGSFRVRRTGEQVLVGERADYHAIVTTDVLDEPPVVLSVNEWDGVTRYTSARELFDHPLAVVIGLSEEEHLAPARAQAATYRWRGLGGSILLLIGLGFLGHNSWKIESLRRREREYRLAHARRIEHLAFHDGLTGLPNRASLTRIIDDRIRLSQRYGHRFALIFLDLDGFKQINDTLGHDAGDDLLSEVAKRLEDGLRQTDTVARMGGDEFMIVLPEIESEDQVTAVADKVLASLAEPFVLLGEKFTISASLGISIFPDDGAEEQTLMKNADIAMYVAKDGGRNGYRYYSAEMSAASHERMELETNLRNALAREEFELHYQARRDLRTSRITGMEALIRWNHPELGTIGPGKFLTLAEETGLILPIGRWVMRTACMQNAEWRRAGSRDLAIAVNLSARQFFDPNLCSDVVNALEEADIPPALLELEVSEVVLARDTRKTLPVLKKLRQIGVRITVDNFGTGYSTLSGLGDLPFDTLKVDRLFLRQGVGKGMAKDVIDGVLAVGRVLSPSLVAHGIETREQVDFLRSKAFDQVQGFYFGRPVRAAEVWEALRAEDVELAGTEQAL